MNKINVIFDTNAFIHFSNEPNYSKLINKLHNNKKMVIPNFSLVNFWEIINGINNVKILKQRQELIKKIKHITLGGSVFLQPKIHMQIQIKQVTNEEVQTEYKSLLDHVNAFIGLRSINDFQQIFGEYVEVVFAEISRIVSGYKSMKDFSVKLFKKYKSEGRKAEFKEIINQPPPFDFIETFIPSFIQRYKLKINYNGNDQDKFFYDFPSIKYMVLAFWEYYRRLTFDKKKPEQEDYFDLEQIIYLNIADYLVSADRKLVDIIKSIDDKSLENRVLAPDEFIDLLSKAIIIHKAPQYAARKKPSNYNFPGLDYDSLDNSL